MAPIARRPCLYMEGGCTWQTPQCDQISTIAEAEAYVGRHSAECTFNPTVVEERVHRRRMEAEEVARRAAAEERQEERRQAAELRREAAEAEERREQRDYERQQEAARVAAGTAATHQGGPPPHDPPARPAAPKPAPMPRPTMERQMSQQEWRQFTERWGRYKAVALEPWSYSRAQTANELWACCPKELQDDLQNVGITLASTEQEITDQIKELAVKTPNWLLSLCNFMKMNQKEGEGVRQYSARLRGAADLCDFTVPDGETNYADQMVLGRLVAGHRDKEIAKAVLEESAIKGIRTSRLVLRQVEKLIEVKETARDEAAELNTEEQGLNRVTERPSRPFVRPAAKGKANPGGRPHSYAGASARDGSAAGKPCRNCGRRHGTQERCAATGQTCHRCKMPGHLKAVCRQAAANCAGPPRDDTGAGDLSTVEQLTGTATLLLIQRGGRSRRSAPRQYELRVQPSQQTFSHMEYWGDQWHRTRPAGHPSLVVEATISHATYSKAKSKAPKVAAKARATKLTSMPDTGAMMCIMGRSQLRQLNIERHELVKVTEKMVAANGHSITLDGAVFLDLVVGDRRSTQMVYVSPEVKHMLLSQSACKGLGLVAKEFPNMEEAAEAAKCTASESDDDDGRGCDCPARVEAPDPPAFRPGASSAELERLIKEHYASSAFNTCERQKLPVMEGRPCQLYVDPKARPFAIHTHRAVAVHWADEVKKGLDRDVAMGVIRPVAVGTPTEWCAPMHVVAKKSGKPRRVVDFQKLNAACLRQTHPTKAPLLQCQSVPPNTIKTTMDAWNGYHSVPLREEDRHLTTYLTPWGRYEYCNLPQGHMAAGDAYTARYDEITRGIERMERCIDDTILWDHSVEENFNRVCQYLTHCSRAGITFNEEKFSFGREELEYLGFKLTKNSVEPSEDMLKSIAEFPEPKDITGVRSWFGLTNQVDCFHKDHTINEPLRPFLKPLGAGEKWGDRWGEAQSAAFRASKAKILEAIKEGIESFEPGRTTLLGTDWSRTGMGFHLSQKHCQCEGKVPGCCKTGWKVVLAGSRFTTGAESRYAPVEGEALAVAWALQKTRHFTLGNDKLTVAVDHKPLLKILGDRELGDIDNPRILNFKQKTLRWRFEVVHVPGKDNGAADAMSRFPVETPKGDESWRPWEASKKRSCRSNGQELESEELERANKAVIQAAVCCALEGAAAGCGCERTRERRAAAGCGCDGDSVCGRCSPASEAPGEGPPRRLHGTVHAATTNPKMLGSEEIDKLSAPDPVLKELRQLVESGVSTDAEDWPRHLRSYHVKDADYTVMGHTVLINGKAIVPAALRSEMLAALHRSHSGVTFMQARAREALFWPGMNSDIQRTRDECETCRQIAPSQAATPPKPLPVPEYPFQMMSSDYFQHKGQHYLVLVCRYSGWISVYRAKDLTSKELVSRLREHMGNFGVMDELASDGATVYKSTEVQEFLARFGVRHRVSSAYNPHSNQLAEGAVKSAKRMLEDNTGAQGTLDNNKFLAAQLAHRNKPDPETTLSSSEVVFGRRIKDLVPHAPGKLKVSSRWHETMKMREAVMARRHIARGQELSKHTKKLAPLKVGDLVSIQNQHGNSPLRWDNTGTVVEVGDFDKYTVKVDGSGRLTTRNRRFLRPIRCYKEAISRPAPVAPPPVPAAGPGPAAPAVPASTPTAPAAPRRSARVAKRTYADAAASRRPSHQ